jgi:RNA recognition motif-containing protein
MVDRKSVFVGNLPQGTTEGHLQTIFHHCGTIQLITVHQSRSIRPGMYFYLTFSHHIIIDLCADSEYNVFAFVEFTQPSAVLFAIEKVYSP